MDDNIRKNPWRGLESYREGEILYGRDEDIRDLTQAILNNIDTLLYGKSGIGKSSILNAGILPIIRRHGYVPIVLRLSHKKDEDYQAQIRTAIEEAVSVVEIVAVKDAEKESLYEYFHRHTFHSPDGRKLKLLLIFDQYEEIFTLQTDEHKKKAFFSQLADMLNDIMPSELQPVIPAEASTHSKIQEPSKSSASGVTASESDMFGDMFSSISFEPSGNDAPQYVNDNEIRFIFTIREDFLSEFEYYTSNIPSLKQNRYGLRPINEEQAAQIIMKPVKGMISLPVAELIIQKVTGRIDFKLDGIPEIEVDSAVLSLYLSRLYEAKDSDVISADLVEQKGGEIIADFYDDAISDISASTVEYLESMLLNGQGRRDNITVYDALNEGGVTDEELDTLCNRKKILRQFNYAGVLRIEFVHDILCPVVRHHREERRLLLEQEEDRRRQEEETLRIRKEEENKRREIERKAAQEKALILEEARKARKRNRQRILAALIIILTLIGGGFFWYWYTSWEHVSYYADYELIDGWPHGIGNELSDAERASTPLYCRLSHKGHLPHDTDVEILSSNPQLPSSPRISFWGSSERKAEGNEKAEEFNALLSKVKKIQFVEGENGRIDKEKYFDSEGDILFVRSYFHLPDINGAWVTFLNSQGGQMQIRDNGIDRIKLQWDSTLPGSLRNSIVSELFYDQFGENLPIDNKGRIYALKKNYAGNVKSTTLVDVFGLPIVEDCNLIRTERNADGSVTTDFRRIANLSDSLSRPAVMPQGYSSITKSRDRNVYMLNGKEIAVVNFKRDNRGNIISSDLVSGELKDFAPSAKYAYDSNGNCTREEFIGNSDGIFSRDRLILRSFDRDGKLIKEDRYDDRNDLTYHFLDSLYGNRRIIEKSDAAKGLAFVREEAISDNDETVRSFYDADNNRINNMILLKRPLQTDTIFCHQIRETTTVDANGNRTITSRFYAFNWETDSMTPLNDSSIGYSSMTMVTDPNDNITVCQLFDESGKTVKSMMYFYDRGNRIGRAAMGVDGTPVRCPRWEEEGLGYYRLLFQKDFNDKYFAICGLNEWDDRTPFFFGETPFSNFGNRKVVFDIADGKAKYDVKGDLMPLDSVEIKKLHEVPFIHILDKESILYRNGFRDNDRIVQLGSWKLGYSSELLQNEWNAMMNGLPKLIKVLHCEPGATSLVMQPVSTTITASSGDSDKAEYHIFGITNREWQTHLSPYLK